jgi:Predicted hydrolase of the metallo-beta-lactamase superfamily
MDNIKIFALGGLDENGKNMYVIETEDGIFIIEAGSKYPDADQLGIEIIIPDFKYLVENKSRIRGLFVTHSHDDVLGGITFLLKQIDIPVYATPFTAVIIEEKLKQDGVKNANIHRIKRSSTFTVGNTRIKTFGMTMSTPDGFGLAIQTKHGNIVFTSEFIVDFDIKNEAFSCDITELAEIGKEGVLCLMTESSGADNTGYTAPKHQITNKIEPFFLDAQDRIIITAYEQNLYRIIEIIEVANKMNRKILFYDDNLRNVLRSIEKLGYYHIPPGLEITKENFTNDLDNIVVLITGGGPTVFRSMFRIATGEDSIIQLNPTDTVIIASPVVAGTEIEASQMINELYKSDVQIKSLHRREISSMHASQEDLTMMLYLFKPKYYLPVNGEYRQLVSNANIAFNMGYFADKIIVLDNGQIATLQNGQLKSSSDFLDVEELMIDGNDNLDASGFVLRDRETLSTDGVIIIGVVVNFKTKEVIGGPDIQSRGLIYLKDADHIIKEVGAIMEDTIALAVKEKRYENMAVRMEVKDKVTKYLLKETGKRPMILPAIVEINATE